MHDPSAVLSVFNCITKKKLRVVQDTNAVDVRPEAKMVPGSEQHRAVMRRIRVNSRNGAPVTLAFNFWVRKDATPAAREATATFASVQFFLGGGLWLLSVRQVYRSSAGFAVRRLMHMHMQMLSVNTRTRTHRRARAGANAATT